MKTLKIPGISAEYESPRMGIIKSCPLSVLCSSETEDYHEGEDYGDVF